MTDTSAQMKWKRYVGDDCKQHPQVKNHLTPFNVALHQALAHWIDRGYYRRDFPQAVHHCASLAFINHAFEGHPRLKGEPLQFPDFGLPPFKQQEKPGTRLYDEVYELAPEVNLYKVERVVNVGFVQWVAEGWHPRDFLEAATDCAQVILYDLSICESLGGLGGGKDSQAFLTQPYKG